MSFSGDAFIEKMLEDTGNDNIEADFKLKYKEIANSLYGKFGVYKNDKK